jgi:hypothetical protein
MHRNDGGIVDAELLRPRWWIAQRNILAGKLLPMNIEELQVHGSAIVTSIEDCPEIAGGEGSVVTATFKTREVNTVVRAEIIGPDGTIELIEGTPIHPIWSVDRNDWVPLGELTEGETLQALGGIATVLSLALVTCSLPVYNIEVHGEHVYQVGELGLLVHNTYPTAPKGLVNVTEETSDRLGRWFARYGDDGAETFSVRLLNGSDELGIAWTGNVRQLVDNIAEVQARLAETSQGSLASHRTDWRRLSRREGSMGVCMPRHWPDGWAVSGVLKQSNGLALTFGTLSQQELEVKYDYEHE